MNRRNCILHTCYRAKNDLTEGINVIGVNIVAVLCIGNWYPGPVKKDLYRTIKTTNSLQHVLVDVHLIFKDLNIKTSLVGIWFILFEIWVNLIHICSTCRFPICSFIFLGICLCRTKYRRINIINTIIIASSVYWSLVGRVVIGGGSCCIQVLIIWSRVIVRNSVTRLIVLIGIGSGTINLLTLI